MPWSVIINNKAKEIKEKMANGNLDFEIDEYNCAKFVVDLIKELGIEDKDLGEMKAGNGSTIVTPNELLLDIEDMGGTTIKNNKVTRQNAQEAIE